MILGFTGTRDGMTTAQRDAFRRFVTDHRPTHFHHGCCVGADDGASAIVVEVMGDRCQIIGHPSDLPGMTSGAAVGRSHVLWEPAPPLRRNHDIAAACEVLAVGPKGPEVVRSGTWATARSARAKRRRVVIFWPNGEVTGNSQPTE